MADHATAFSQYFLQAVRPTQVQLDGPFAVLSAVKDRDVSEAEASECLSRSLHWVWGTGSTVTQLLVNSYRAYHVPPPIYLHLSAPEPQCPERETQHTARGLRGKSPGVAFGTQLLDDLGHREGPQVLTAAHAECGSLRGGLTVTHNEHGGDLA